ncbi:malonyl CoA-acyl carrier protein transacylase [Allomyces macrogynus ATCC 38327]|uniref:[acyl-carrier-protein] S-malonyltransferase n=1 Tax=Allomyces macrogynus (strain ATCC 38327) TaxID=578462 RepID=A0A0L0SM69_ALLM3|nr:malonyl CoA-acyl carrier protein transacylase [Allomyces macrogynus ATCC 38327]|eukprot:KNE63656.1 malonyl CoA-acyl carrier protein transacylase [Allomyces macrogynus ATCC 38327]
MPPSLGAAVRTMLSARSAGLARVVPHTQAVVASRSLTSCPLRKPMAVLFPGQGSQYVGMAKDIYELFPAARAVLDEVDDALQFKLTDIMFHGPPDTLTLTCHAQPAILATSAALLAVMREETGLDLKRDAAYVLGHSLGEYTALYAAGSLTLSDAVKLVHKRGQAMQQGLPENVKTSMVALIMRPRKFEALSEKLAEIQASLGPDEVVDLSNVNSSTQAVLSGTHDAVERACRAFQTARIAARAVELPVSAPFHCRLMSPAARAMAPHLAATNFATPQLPVISNVTVLPVTDASQIPDLLVRQITSTVRWHPSIQYCRDVGGIHDFLVFGPNRVLGSLLKKDFPNDRVRLVEMFADMIPVTEPKLKRSQVGASTPGQEEG